MTELAGATLMFTEGDRALWVVLSFVSLAQSSGRPREGGSKEPSVGTIRWCYRSDD